MRMILRTAIVLIGLSLLTGCAERMSMDSSVVFDVRGPVAVDVELFSGDVIVTADDSLRETRVRVVRVGTHGHLRSPEAGRSLPDISKSVSMVPGDLGPVIQVRVYTEHVEEHYHKALVYIYAPVVDGLRVRTSDGSVTAKGVVGPVDIVSSKDDVLVVTNQPMTKPVTILNSYGDIDYRVRGESTALFDCESVNGSVRQNVRYGEMLVYPPTDHDTLHGTLNAGQNPVVLRTVDGDIRIDVVSSPYSYGTLLVNH